MIEHLVTWVTNTIAHWGYPGVLLLTSEFYAPSSYQATGVTWAISTTNATYTAAIAADHNVIVRYV